MTTTIHRLLLQFHITGRCNLRCQHCYRTEGDVEPLTHDDIVRVIEQYIDLLDAYNAHYQIRHKGHINITGGEPFCRADIREILTLLGSHRDRFSYGVLSNGSFLDNDMIALLRDTAVSFVQLSIDGDRTTHDALRAPGDYDRVLNTAQTLEANGIRTYISFTANKSNMHHLPHVASECRKRHITKLWTDRLVPIGGGEEMRSLSIGKEELFTYLRHLRKAQGHILTHWRYPHTSVTANRALQFLAADGAVYSCSAGKSLITVDEFGRILPCRRMPIVCGDIAASTLKDIYFNHETFVSLRHPVIPKACASCVYVRSCRGGARCQAYAATGSFFNPDPACPRLTPP